MDSSRRKITKTEGSVDRSDEVVRYAEGIKQENLPEDSNKEEESHEKEGCIQQEKVAEKEDCIDVQHVDKASESGAIIDDKEEGEVKVLGKKGNSVRWEDHGRK